MTTATVRVRVLINARDVSNSSLLTSNAAGMKQAQAPPRGKPELKLHITATVVKLRWSSLVFVSLSLLQLLLSVFFCWPTH